MPTLGLPIAKVAVNLATSVAAANNLGNAAMPARLAAAGADLILGWQRGELSMPRLASLGADAVREITRMIASRGQVAAGSSEQPLSALSPAGSSDPVITRVRAGVAASDAAPDVAQAFVNHQKLRTGVLLTRDVMTPTDRQDLRTREETPAGQTFGIAF